VRVKSLPWLFIISATVASCLSFKSTAKFFEIAPLDTLKVVGPNCPFGFLNHYDATNVQQLIIAAWLLNREMLKAAPEVPEAPQPMGSTPSVLHPHHLNS